LLGLIPKEEPLGLPLPDFFIGQMPSGHPTNGIKAVKGKGKVKHAPQESIRVLISLL